MKFISYLALLFGLLLSHQALAVVTSPASFTPSGTCCSYQPISLINQTGLSGGLDGGLHDTVWQNMWMGDNGIFPTLDFDMGEVVGITAAHIWQYNSVENGLSRGVDDFDIFYSEDGINYTALGSANLTVSAGGSIPAQVVPMVANARYIRFIVTSNYGDSYSGLSEVAFDVGGVVPVEPEAETEPVPGLSFWMTLLLSLFVLAVGLRRYRSI